MRLYNPGRLAERQAVEKFEEKAGIDVLGPAAGVTIGEGKQLSLNERGIINKLFEWGVQKGIQRQAQKMGTKEIGEDLAKLSPVTRGLIMNFINQLEPKSSD